MHTPAHQASLIPAGDSSRGVFLSGDGLSLSPIEHAELLARLSAEHAVIADEYGLGGMVAEVEMYFAKLLGKERAVFMPTGTLANQTALRLLAGPHSRVIVQDVSHVYNDAGDACQKLSGLNLIPLAPGRATFTLEEVEQVLARTASGRVATQVGAISIESPVRRRRGELFDIGELHRICALARERGIGLHLDGARLFMASAYTGISPAEYAADFDTVYVSLWKCFNALNGAVLAGPARLLDELFHTRRMFGGALWAAWPFALVARHHAEGFLDRFRAAIDVSEVFIAALGEPFCVERVPSGSHMFFLKAKGVDLARLRERLAETQIYLPGPSSMFAEPTLLLGVNETWNRTTGVKLAESFHHACS